ncbi:hypothetical protein GCM10027423_36360 [Spirosoma arcticum]
MSEQIQRELAEYQTLTNEDEKVLFWERVRASDARLSKEDRSLINQVIADDVEQIKLRVLDLKKRVDDEMLVVKS